MCSGCSWWCLKVSPFWREEASFALEVGSGWGGGMSTRVLPFGGRKSPLCQGQEVKESFSKCCFLDF